jgi:hypothetical protein
MLDLRSMFGYPKSRFSEIFGPTGVYVKIIWHFVAPIQISVCRHKNLKLDIYIYTNHSDNLFRDLVHPNSQQKYDLWKREQTLRFS